MLVRAWPLSSLRTEHVHHTYMLACSTRSARRVNTKRCCWRVQAREICSENETSSLGSSLPPRAHTPAGQVRILMLVNIRSLVRPG